MEDMEKLKKWLYGCDKILIGAGAGLSASCGFSYSGKRFHDNFADFERAFGFHDMYSGGFYPFSSDEVKWAYWSRFINLNRYSCGVGQAYKTLFELVKGRDYFVLTTNVDHQFQRAGFDKKRLFYTQGDYGLFQCSVPCHNGTYDNKEQIFAMVEAQKDMKIPSELVPRCPVCGAPMTTNLRADDKFVEDEGWHAAADNYEKFLKSCEGSKTLLLELGVGMNTPVIIKFPFWKAAASHENFRYACLDLRPVRAPFDFGERAVYIAGDMANTLKELTNRI